MDLENQRRILSLSEKYPRQDLLVILGGGEAEASGLACETVTNGDPSFAGPLAGVQLGLLCYHVVEDDIKWAVDAEVYQQQVGMMEMVLDVDALVKEVRHYREKYCHYLEQSCS